MAHKKHTKKVKSFSNMSPEEKACRRQPSKRIKTTWVNPDTGEEHSLTYRGKNMNVATIERIDAAGSYPDPDIAKRKAELATIADKALSEGGDKSKLNQLTRSIWGRQALTKALKDKGLDPSHYADIVEKAYNVGMGDGPDAKDSRKHFTATIEKLGNVDGKKEEKAPQVLVVIGDNFKAIADALDGRNTGHPMEAAPGAVESNE